MQWAFIQEMRGTAGRDAHFTWRIPCPLKQSQLSARLDLYKYPVRARFLDPSCGLSGDQEKHLGFGL